MRAVALFDSICLLVAVWAASAHHPAQPSQAGDVGTQGANSEGGGTAGPEQPLPQQQLDWSEERAWLEEASSALERSDYPLARDLLARAIDRLLSRSPSERDETCLGLLDRAGRSAWAAQDSGTAKRAFERLLEIRIRALPADHPEIQRTRANLAVVTADLGDLAGARALQEVVLEVLTRTLPADHPHLQAARANLAATMHSQGEFAGAHGLQRIVLEVLTRTLPPEHPDVLRAKQNLALTMQSLGDLAGARALQELVLEVLARTLPADHPDLQLAQESLAGTVFHMGDLQAARALEERVLEARTRTLPPDHPALQSVQGNLATTIAALGDLAGARALQEAVLEVSSRNLPADHPSLQRARTNLAVTMYYAGDLAGARALQAGVLEVLTRTLPWDHPELQLARQNLAVTIKDLGDLHWARDLQEEVLEVFSRILPVDHPSIQNARGNLAVVIKSLGDLATARALEEELLAVLARVLPPDHPDLQQARANLAVSIAAQCAQRAQGRGSEEEGGGGMEDGSGRCVELIGALCRSQVRAAREAVLASSRRAAEERSVSMGYDLGMALSFALGYGAFEPAAELLADAFVLSEATRGVALVSAAIARGAAGSERYRELRGALGEAGDELAAQARAGTTSEGFQAAVRARDALEVELVEFARELVGFDLGILEVDPARLASALGEGRAAVAYRRFTRRSVRFATDGEGIDSAAPIEEGVESLCAFVVRGGVVGAEEALSLLELGPIAPIEAAVAAWRAELGAGGGRGLGLELPSTPGAVEQLGLDLRARILDPLLPALGDARHIVLVLDDVLHVVPFDALPAHGTADGTEDREAARPGLLGERYRLEVRSVLGELLGDPQPVGVGLLVTLGGASFDSEPLGPGAEEGSTAEAASVGQGPRGAMLLRGSAWEAGFTPLIYTQQEAHRIAALHGEVFEAEDTLVLDRRRASRESLEELAPRARWLHVATHGWYAADSMRSWQDLDPLDHHSGLGLRASGESQMRGSSPMLLCGLAFAGANLPADAVGRVPGLMTAEELSTLDLSGCELAVLSACDTNVGERRPGQGVASLQKALHMAGAKSVITSLWKVPDEATSELMLEFYRRLWVEGKPKHQALWEAKMRLRDAVDERGNPLYTVRDWAGWVLTGEPD